MSEEGDGGDEDGDGGGCGGGRASPASSFDAFHLLLLISPLSLSPSVTLPPSPISVTMAEDKFCPPFPSNFAA